MTNVHDVKRLEQMSCYDICELIEGGHVLIDVVETLVPFPGNRRKRCANCNSLIENREMCYEITRDKIPKGEVEERIYGEDGLIKLPPHYLCNKCSGLYFPGVKIPGHLEVTQHDY